jgi:hypothetical protein
MTTPLMLLKSLKKVEKDYDSIHHEETAKQME